MQLILVHVDDIEVFKFNSVSPLDLYHYYIILIKVWGSISVTAIKYDEKTNVFCL